MIDFTDLYSDAQGTDLEPLVTHLRADIEQGLREARWGDLPGWLEALSRLPAAEASIIDLQNQVSVGDASDLSPAAHIQLLEQLQNLKPWRKGPLTLFGIHIDTEWRSDWKWARVAPHIHPLTDRLVLDVGCGNGYYALRMLGAGARRVIGIDPSARFVVQFEMVKKYLGPVPVHVLPVGIEALPVDCALFDTTFSMGVFYHRRSPMDHLRELKNTLRGGGELVLETLVIEGGPGEVLVPEGRYAMMNNVWFLPSSLTLLGWLKKCGFRNARVVDETSTTLDEQRSTPWMTFHSLEKFLDPEDPTRTIEGHPAPRRAVFVAEV